MLMMIKICYDFYFVISTIGEITSQEKKLREKKKGFIQPNLQEIKSYFQENNFPIINEVILPNPLLYQVSYRFLHFYHDLHL